MFDEDIEGPNTLTLPEIRLAGQGDTPFQVGTIYVDHLVAALPATQETTHLHMVNGLVLEVNMSVTRFARRQRLDRSST